MLPASLRGWFSVRAARWAARVSARDRGEVVLGQRRIYIVPTGAGLGFGALLLVLLLGSVNYNLGLGYALTFLAAACALVDMVFTWRNLAHLRLRPLRCGEVFAGEDAVFTLGLAHGGATARHAITLAFVDSPRPPHTADVPAHGSSTVALALPTTQRGTLAAPRVRLSTRFPLGLFQAWAYWQPDLRALVWPAPEADAPPLPVSSASGDGAGRGSADDLAGVRPYQPGDPLRQLAWRQIARLGLDDGGQLATKHFDGGAARALELDLAALPPRLDLEQRLARLARWVLEAERQARPYALRLGAVHLPAARGAAHRTACLDALARYGQPGGAP